MLTQENLDNIAVWQEALLSKQYKQAKGCLNNITQGGMCCLGVALDVWEQPKWVPLRAVDAAISAPTLYDTDEVGGVESSDDYTAVGGAIYGLMPQATFKFRTGLENWVQDTLSAENDGGKTFEEISEIIQKIISNPINHIQKTDEELDTINLGEYDDLEY